MIPKASQVGHSSCVMAVPQHGRKRSQGSRCNGSASAKRLALDGASAPALPFWSLYGAWQEQAKTTREIADHATNDNAKKLLLMIADDYDRLSQ